MHTITKHLKRGLVLLSAQFFLFAQCNKEPSPCRGGGGYAFLATAEWSPEKTSYQVGDTLYLTSRIPKRLTDQINTSMVVDYSNTVGIGGIIGISRPDSQTKQNIPAVDSFRFLPVEEAVLRHPDKPEILLTSKYNTSGSEFVFRMMLICQKKGFYALAVDDLGSKGLQGKNCSNATFDKSVTNNNRNEIRYQNALGITLDPQSLKKLFCFEVQ